MAIDLSKLSAQEIAELMAQLKEHEKEIRRQQAEAERQRRTEALVKMAGELFPDAKAVQARLEQVGLSGVSVRYRIIDGKPVREISPMGGGSNGTRREGVNLEAILAEHGSAEEKKKVEQLKQEYKAANDPKEKSRINSKMWKVKKDVAVRVGLYPAD